MAKRRSQKKKVRAGRPPPKCKAILLCDQTIVEEGTASISIIGVFDRLGLSSVPGLTDPCAVFLQLVDGIGLYDIVVEIQDLRENQVLARASGLEIEFPERLRKLNLVIPVPAVPLAHVGRYDVVVLANGQEIDRQQFYVFGPGSDENETETVQDSD